MKKTTILKFYGWLFAASGALFALGPGLVEWFLNGLAAALPGCRPIPNGAPTFWLGLSGSMMAMISYLSFSLAADEDQPLAWNTLLLSKGASTALFGAFALAERNALFLVGSLTDGSIFLHLLCLRPRTFYEVWFAKLNDPVSRSALWLRYTVTRGARESAALCWYILFDRERGKVTSGRFPSTRLDLGDFSHARLEGRNDGVSWDIHCEDAGAPAFAFVPAALKGLGIAASEYVTPVSLGRFRGTAVIDGREWRFEGAPGSVGHIWGKRMAHSWRWAHAVCGESVVEILSAQVKVGPFLSPVMTCANLWHAGRHYRSTSLAAALSNRSTREGEAWKFRIDFGELVAEGESAPDPGLTAELLYDSPDGRRLICRNSKTGRLRLALIDKKGGSVGELFTEDGAAVEYVAPA